MRKKKRKHTEKTHGRKHTEETKQKMRDAYKARTETKKVKELQEFDSTIDVRQQIADFLGLPR